jgi:hypothetical protein
MHGPGKGDPVEEPPFRDVVSIDTIEPGYLQRCASGPLKNEQCRNVGWNRSSHNDDECLLERLLYHGSILIEMLRIMQLRTMRFILTLVLFAFFRPAHTADTLRFHSKAFGTERTVIVHIPEFLATASDLVKAPVFILLDGQHDWFIQPLLNDIRYLQYTHEVPQAIVVVVPHVDRVVESAESNEQAGPMPLLQMLTDELPNLLIPYHPGTYQVLIGHSFTASFALYAKQQAPETFDAVIAISPLHRVGHYLPGLAQQLRERPNDDVLIAVGGADRSKDGHHHASLMSAWNALPPEKGRMLLKEYPSAGHTSIPVVAFPELLSTLFMDFALRDSLASVDEEYVLEQPPPSPEKLMQQVEANLRFRGDTLPWEVAEINGLASRLWTGDHVEHVLAIYRRGVELYPNDLSVNWSLGEVLLPTDRRAGERYLRKALQLLETSTLSEAERAEARSEIEELLR